MNEALNNPVIKRTRREVHSADMPIDQRESIDVSDGIDHENIVIASPHITNDSLKMLAFMEEPVSIMIQKANEKHAPIVVDCWVNGRGAEVFQNGQWLVLGYLPVGREIITRRKYVEVLARSKVDNVTTDVIQSPDSEQNLVNVGTSSKAPFSVIEDRNPLGREWLSRLMREQS